MAANRSAMKDAAGAALSGQRGNRSDSLDEYSSTLMGEIKRGDGVRITAAPINIYLIHPDATQPRRALPTEVRRAWDGSPTSLPVLFMEWMKAIDGWRSLIVSILNGEEVERPEIVQPLTAALIEIADLAASIRRDGLTNPITVVRQGEEYIIETGERRWLAYHLLVAHTGDESWTKIPARVVEQFNRWRQAAENNTRKDLNAIGKARQLAVLLMELIPNAAEFLPLDRFEHEQQFYAQVADGEEFRTPRGKGQLLLSAMGLSHSDQIRQHRALLRLPRDLWDAADDGNWTIADISDYRDLNHGIVSQTPQFGISNPPTPSSIKKAKKFLSVLPDDLWQEIKDMRGVSQGWKNYEKPLRDSAEERLRKIKKWVDDELGEG